MTKREFLRGGREVISDKRKYLCRVERLFPINGNTFVG